MKKIKRAFTLVELVFAVGICAIVLFIVFGLTVNSMEEMSYSVRNSRVLVATDDLHSELNSYKNLFSTGGVIIDNVSGVGNDVLVLKDSSGDGGVVFGVVDKNTMKIESNSGSVYYRENVIGYKELSASEVIELEGDSSVVYDYVFYKDKIFDDLKVKDFQLSFYNNGSIMELDIRVVINFEEGLLGTLFSEMGIEDTRRIILDF